MAFWDRWIRKPRATPPPDAATLLAEERRMEIREAALRAGLARLEEEGERLFRSGAAATGEDDRRAAARRLVECAAQVLRCRRDLRRVAKEIRALSRLRRALEDGPTPASPWLERFTEVEAFQLEQQLVDDRVTEQGYEEKLNAILGLPREADLPVRLPAALRAGPSEVPSQAPPAAATPEYLPDPEAPDAEERLIARWREGKGR